MILLKDIPSQDRAVRYLKRSVDSGKIANAYLFIGPGGVGKSIAAKAFLAEIMCIKKRDPVGALSWACGECRTCSLIEKSAHPDILWIKNDMNKFIKIDEIRRVKDALSVKPYEANANVCVIEDASMMTNEAANSLLKILEEPPGKSMIILISANREMILPTVISRCLEVRFDSLPWDLSALEGPILSKRKELVSYVASISNAMGTPALSWRSEERDDLIDTIELLITIMRDALMIKVGESERVFDSNMVSVFKTGDLVNYSADRINIIIKKLVGIKRSLTGNVNPKIVSEVLPGVLTGSYD